MTWTQSKNVAILGGLYSNLAESTAPLSSPPLSGQPYLLLGMASIAVYFSNVAGRFATACAVLLFLKSVTGWLALLKLLRAHILASFLSVAGGLALIF